MIQVPRRRLGWRVTAGILATLLSAPVSLEDANRDGRWLRQLCTSDEQAPRAMGASAPMHASKGHGQTGPVDCDYVPQLTLRGSVAACRPARYQGYIRRLPLLIVARLFIIGAADAVRRGPGGSGIGSGYFASPPANARVVLGAFLRSGMVRVPAASAPATHRRPAASKLRRQPVRQKRCALPSVARGANARPHHRHFVTLMPGPYVSA
jgi:hypothetical protein